MSGISIKSRISVICLSRPPTADHASAFPFSCSVVAAFELVLVFRIPLTPLGEELEGWMRDQCVKKKSKEGCTGGGESIDTDVSQPTVQSVTSATDKDKESIPEDRSSPSPSPSCGDFEDILWIVNSRREPSYSIERT